eukprot:2022039-Rhodomonas_salina.2
MVGLTAVLLVPELRAKVIKGEGRTVIQDAQGNVIFPCGYRGGSKSRTSAEAVFEEHEVSLSSTAGIGQIDKDRELQVSDPPGAGTSLDGADRCVGSWRMPPSASSQMPLSRMRRSIMSKRCAVRTCPPHFHGVRLLIQPVATQGPAISQMQVV